MKTVRVAVVILLFCLVAVIVNSVVLRRVVGEITERVVAAEEKDFSAAEEEYSDIFDDFKRAEIYLGFTVNHEDITDVKDCFAEIMGAIKAEDDKTLIIAKNRLINSLEHIRRLAGINVDSIF